MAATATTLATGFYPRSQKTDKGYSARCHTRQGSHLIRSSNQEQPSWPASIKRRDALLLALSAPSLPLLPLSALAEADEAFQEYKDDLKGFSIQVPPSWIQKDKAGATVLFEDPERPGTNAGVVVNPVRIQSLSDFGTLDFVAQKLIDAETRKESTKDAHILAQSESTLPGGTPLYNFEYSLASTRGDKRLLTSATIAQGKLYILNIAAAERGAPLTDETLQQLRAIQKSFYVQ